MSWHVAVVSSCPSLSRVALLCSVLPSPSRPDFKAQVRWRRRCARHADVDQAPPPYIIEGRSEDEVRSPATYTERGEQPRSTSIAHSHCPSLGILRLKGKPNKWHRSESGHKGATETPECKSQRPRPTPSCSSNEPPWLRQPCGRRPPAAQAMPKRWRNRRERRPSAARAERASTRNDHRHEYAHIDDSPVCRLTTTIC